MFTMQNQVKIDCPVEKVFSFLATPENLPQWNYYLRSVEKISDGNPIIGARYHQQRINDEQWFTISGYEKNKFIEFSSSGGTWFKFKRRVDLVADHNTCVINDCFEIRTFLPSFFIRIIAKRPQAAVKENLLKLKELLETGKTMLQDGRMSIIE